MKEFVDALVAPNRFRRCFIDGLRGLGFIFLVKQNV